MKNFYLSSMQTQSLLMICLFFTLILSLNFLIISYDRNKNKWHEFLNLGLFLILFFLLSSLLEAFENQKKEIYFQLLRILPIWLLWCIVGISEGLIIYMIICWAHERKQWIDRNSIKQAIDTLPSAICYFTQAGTVKLCNLQMHHLFRSLAQRDLQIIDELHQALELCDSKSDIKKVSDKIQTYLFPDGEVWYYSENKVVTSDGEVYTESVFTNITQIYQKSLLLKEQIKQIQKIDADIKLLSENVQALTKEDEVLRAKTRLHDQMGAGLIAIRRALQQEESSGETEDAIQIFQKAVNIIKRDNIYPLDRSEFAEFMQDAKTIGVKIDITGDLPQQDEVYRVFVIAMRECLTNSVRHGDATELSIHIFNDDHCIRMNITNNGDVSKCGIIPKGGLLNLHRHITNLGGTMEIKSIPIFKLIVAIPIEEEEGL